MEYNEGDIAEDGNGNFMVYRGGGWHPSTEQGRPLQRIPRPDYGDRYYELPNGDIVREGPRGGMEVIENAGARGGAGAANGAPPITSEQRGRLVFGISPASRAQQRLAAQEAGGNAPMNDQWGAALLDAVPDLNLMEPLARLWGGQEYQDYDQAIATISASLLPIFSGMAVTDSEAQRFIKANVPRVGDTPETLAEKARNRSEVINAGAWLLGRELPFPEVGIYGVEGQEGRPAPLPEASPTVNAVANSVFDSPEIVERDGKVFYAVGLEPGQGAPANLQTRYGADGEISADDMLAAGYVPDQETGKWLYPADNGPLPPDGPAGPQGGGGGGGIADLILGGNGQGTEGYRQAKALERQNADLIAPVAGVRMDNQFFAPVQDELAYAAGYLNQGVGNIGRRLTGRDIEISAAERGRASRDVMREDQDRFAREHPGQNITAQVLGGLSFGPGAGARTMAGRMAQGAGIGGAYAFADADGSVAERAPAAAGGAAIGAVAVPAIERVAAPALNALARPVVETAQAAGRFGGRQAGRVGNALGVPGSQQLIDASAVNPLQSGINRFAERMGPQRVNALAPALAERRGAGIDQATLIDALDDGSIGRMRALATRDTPARERMVTTAESRRRNLPSRAARIASEEISQDTRPALQAIDELGQTRRANASAIDTFGNDTVPVTPDVVQALRSDFVRPFLRQAATRAQGATDPLERDAAARLTRLADTAIDNPAGVQLTVRESQDVSKALNDAASAAYRAGSPDGPVLANLARTIRDTARDNSQGYANWLRQYGDDSSLMEAATTGRNFVSVSRDPVNARGTEAFVQRAGEAGPAELGIQRAAAREAVETAASNPSGARTTLEGFASDAGQYRRAQAIGANADRLQTRASAELDSVTRHQRASPRIGSESSGNLQDAADTAGVVIQAATNPIKAGASWAINRLASRGFSNSEAEAIVTAATDPAQTDALVGMLAQRMTRREARNLARAIRYQITTNPPSGRQR